MTTSACPDRTAWKALLRGQISSDEEQRLQQHLDRCPQCQKALEMSAGSTTFLVDLAAKLQRTHSELSPDLANLLDTANGDEAEVTQIDDRQPFVVDPTTLLTPSQQPHVLGMIDTFEVLEVLGQGGMGVVFKARDPKLRRLVAIKVLSPFLLADQTSRQRFLREARAAAAVNHPHAVTIYSVHDPAEESLHPAHSRCPYLVMEFVDGPSLHRRIARNNPMTVKEVLRVASHVAFALVEFHARGLIHRDVKPANILLDAKSGRAKLSDFGLTRGPDDPTLTKTGIVVGTPAFMSPEQAFGEVIDHRSDLFSLGSSMFAMLTGRAPFRDQDTMQILLRLRSVPPPSIAKIRDDLSPELVRLIDHLHAVDPRERPQSAAAVLTELRRLRGLDSDWLPDEWEGEAPAEPRTSEKCGSAGASSSRIPASLAISAQRVKLQEDYSRSQAVPILPKLNESQSNERASLAPSNHTANSRHSSRRQQVAILSLFAIGLSSIVWTIVSMTMNSSDNSKSNGSAAATSSPHVVDPSTLPFVLLDEEGRSSRSAATLSKALELATSDKLTRIRVCGDGPYPMKPISIRDRRLWIEAAEHARPIFVFDWSRNSEAAMIDTNESLTLAGIELQASDLTMPAENSPPLIHSEGAELNLIHCCFRGTSTKGPLIRTTSLRANIRDSILISGATAAVIWTASANGTLTLNNNACAGFGAILIESSSPPPRETHIELIDNTFISQFPVQVHFGKRQEANQFDRRQLRFTVERNQFRALQSVIAISWSIPPAIMLKRPELMLPLVIQWGRDIDNLYSLNANANWISHRFPDTDWSAMSLSPRDLPIWINFWKNRPTATSRSVLLEFARPGLINGADSQRLDLSATDFRVPQIGRMSNPPGADVSQLGPDGVFDERHPSKRGL